MDSRTAGPLGVAQVELEIRIHAAPQRVWRALVQETTRWWPKAFSIRVQRRAGS